MDATTRLSVIYVGARTSGNLLDRSADSRVRNSFDLFPLDNSLDWDIICAMPARLAADGCGNL